MKKCVMFFLFLISLTSIVSASINVRNSTIDDSYVKFDSLKGKLNVTISDEDFLSELTSNQGGSIILGDFLEQNGANYSCSPYDCSSGYTPTEGSTAKIFTKKSSDTVYFGFVVQGTNVQITNINFSLASDFQEGMVKPLYLNFFEDYDWSFNNFSDNFGPENFGCYSSTVPTPGPLIRTSSYCETVNITETNSVFVGALVDSLDNEDLTMAIYSNEGGYSLGECKFTPGIEQGCEITDEDALFSSGTYHVCVSAEEPTDYHLYSESTGPVCGFVYAEGAGSGKSDYAIFAKSAKYADYHALNSTFFSFEELTIAADNLIEERYNRNCTNKCVLPVSVKGIAQNFRVHDVSIDYYKQGGDFLEDKVYSIDVEPASVYFNGLLDFALTGFKVIKEGDFILYLNDEKFFDEEFFLIPAPIITTLTPLNPPAGIPVLFYMSVDFDSKSNLTYKWDFGDGSSKETTDEPFTFHTFKEIKNYSVNVEASAGGNLTSKKKFSIFTISPKDAINSSITERKQALTSFLSELNVYPAWYQDEIKKLINVSYYQSEIARLEKSRDNAHLDSDYLKIAVDLFKMDVPMSIYTTEQSEFPLLTEVEEINPRVISDFAGGGYEEDFESYKGAIIKWQNENIEAKILSEMISLLRFSGSVEPLISSYSVSFTSHSDESESYIVINKPIEDIYFKEDPGARKIGDSVVVILDGNNRKSFDFYYTDEEPITFFISPKLTTLVLEENIDLTCNKNSVCEPENGETADNCRDDCKPTGRMIFYIILAIIFGLILYSLVQVWYRRRYESYLFDGDRRELYNLTMYIANARVRGISYDQIERDLKKQGWSGERVDYAIKKSQGKNTGLPEIIPFVRIRAYLTMNQAKKSLATNSQQQGERNINKYSFQRGV